jgi:SAM-dependent methyltransferase
VDIPVEMIEISYDLLGLAALVVFLLWLGNFLSYRLIKDRVLRERRWDYNICCGTTDGGGINADIVQHGSVGRFELVEDVTALPYADAAFEHVLCSHTLEHVDDPRAMFEELQRVGRHVTVLVPPLWDLAGTLNPFEHRVIFLTLRSRHDNRLPRFVSYAPGRWLQRIWGQHVRADHRDVPIPTPAKGATGSVRWERSLPFVAPALWLSAAFLFAAENEIGFAVLLLAFWVLRRTRAVTAAALSTNR